MKKIMAFLIGLIIFFNLIIIYNFILDNKIIEKSYQLYYIMDDKKFNNMIAAKACLENTNSDNILLLGSSEFGSFDKSIVNNANSNFNMYIVGRGLTQSLQSALSLGGIANNVEMDKVALIISPQWFEESGRLTYESFASRFQVNSFNNFMNNEKISKATKLEVINELKKLEMDKQIELDKYENAYFKYNIIDKLYLSMSQSVYNTKQKLELLEILPEEDSIHLLEDKVKFENYNFSELLEIAEKKGEKSCTNNAYGIENEYYNTYVKGKEFEYKDSNIKSDFTNEEEYKHLELFLKVCEELGIKPLIVNVPVNGYWYDFTGFSIENRKHYYEKIRNLVKKYNAEIADFSCSEYEKYFLKDRMHLGWKGWIKVDEAIYKYYKQK